MATRCTSWSMEGAETAATASSTQVENELDSSIPFFGVYFVFTRRWLPCLRFFVRLALPTVTVD